MNEVITFVSDVVGRLWPTMDTHVIIHFWGKMVAWVFFFVLSFWGSLSFLKYVKGQDRDDGRMFLGLFSTAVFLSLLVSGFVTLPTVIEFFVNREYLVIESIRNLLQSHAH